MLYFKDKVVWVTGASSGIGEALVMELANQGAKIILSSRRYDELERVAIAAKLAEGSYFILPLDLEAHDTLEDKTLAALDFFGTVDVMIHNGGISQRARAEHTSIDVDRKIIDVNFLGTIALTKALLQHFIPNKKGHFAVVTSLVGKFGTPMQSSYAASKHALHGFFDSLRAEHFIDNIKVTLLCPGFVQTQISVNALTGDGTAQMTMDKTTDNGLLAQECAKRMLKAIVAKKEEVYIGRKEVLAVYLKRFFPKLFSRFIKNRKLT